MTDNLRYADFFTGLADGLKGERARKPPPGLETFGAVPSDDYFTGNDVAEGFLQDVLTNEAPGISIGDMIDVALEERGLKIAAD